MVSDWWKISLSKVAQTDRHVMNHIEVQEMLQSACTNVIDTHMFSIDFFSLDSALCLLNVGYGCGCGNSSAIFQCKNTPTAGTAV